MSNQDTNSVHEFIADGQSGQSVENPEARTLDSIDVWLSIGDFSCCRAVAPAGDATLTEILAAMKQDEDFVDPLVDKGNIECTRGRTRVLLATYTTSDSINSIADITEVTAFYSDDTSEAVPLD